MLETVLSPVEGLVEGGAIWLEALPARTYKTSQYGEVVIDRPKLENFVNNFKSGVRGQEIATDFDHGVDRAKGNKASGWYRDFEIRPSAADSSEFSLWANVELTDEAKQEIADKQWKYFSLEWSDEYDTETGIVKDVVVGGGFTNRPIAKGMVPINFSEIMRAMSEVGDKDTFLSTVSEMLTDVYMESKEMEHSEPGTGSPPAPKKEGDGSDDPAIKSGSRRDPLPTNLPDPENKGGDLKLTPEQIAALYEHFELDAEKDEDGTKLVELATTAFSEAKALREAVSQSSEEKSFAEQYPQMWSEHVAMIERDRNRNAIEFSETVATVKRAEGDGFIETENGLSALALESVAYLHKKFAEGTATLEDFEACLKAIVDGGIVKFGEEGSSREREAQVIEIGTAQGISDARKLFAEKITETQRANEDMTYEDAVREAGKLYPDLANAYRMAVPA